MKKWIKYVLTAIFVSVITTACDSDYSETGRGFIFTIGLVGGFGAYFMLEGDREGKESFVATIIAFAIIGIFSLVAYLIPEEAANAVGIGIVVIGSIVAIVLFILQVTNKKQP